MQLRTVPTTNAACANRREHSHLIHKRGDSAQSPVKARRQRGEDHYRPVPRCDIDDRLQTGGTVVEKDMLPGLPQRCRSTPMHIPTDRVQLIM